MKRNNIDKCRSLRKNQTDAEKKLWGLLRNRQLNNMKFRRQYSVGKYILDFYCPEIGLGIEADGGQHYGDAGKEKDELRTRELSSIGIKIMRFSNRDILTNSDGVYEIINSVIEKKKAPSPQSSPPVGEEVTTKWKMTKREDLLHVKD
jgi:very-short-patch-repair endonuclease